MSLDKTIKGLKASFSKELSKSKTSSDLEKFRIKYLGRNGQLASLFEEFNKLPASEKPRFGKELNILKNELLSMYQDVVGGSKVSSISSNTDFSLPGYNLPDGNVHPLEQITYEIKSIFQSIGFSVAYGPEIDDDYHNFEALNIPKHHPARDMQDTFYINSNDVLRTHTSNTQIHLMENSDPPIRVICPGRVFRNEAISIRSYCLFHQIEGLYINKNVSFSEMKGTIEYFCKKFFGENVVARFRPSFFPFTEPSAEVDISCMMCNGKGCSMCKKTGWLEILGCGLVDPEVLKNVGYDPEIWSGYAWGMGIERMAILKYGIDDIRLFFNGNVKFLRQF